MDKLPLIFCAIDTPDINAAHNFAAAMTEAGCGIKLGLEFFSMHGTGGVAKIRKAFPDTALFLDLKFHDIPNTVAGAVRSACNLQPSYMTVHASGGNDMMRAAQDAAQNEAIKTGVPIPSLLAVTVLTSLDDTALEDVGQMTPAGMQVLRLARLAKEAGLPGVVCAGPDIQALRTSIGNEFILMVPGIRPAGAATQDQKRVMSPPEAIKTGATHLVIGRPITEAPDPAQAARNIIAGLQSVQVTAA